MSRSMEIWADEYIKANSKYRTQVEKFIEFLKKPDVDKVDQPAAITQEDITAFISSSKQIESISTMKNYLEGIKSFDNFLVNKDHRSSYIIRRGDAYKFYKKELASMLGLKETIERNGLSSETIQAILNALDNYFLENTFVQYNLLSSEGKERYIYWLCLRLYIKISLFVPIKKTKLLALKFSNFTENLVALKVLCIDSIAG